jgi:hypothetical protein
MTALNNLTPEQKTAVLALMKDFAARLAPAKLKDTNRNGLLLADWVNVNRGGIQSAENLYAAANALYKTLDWQTKPEKLLRDEREQKVATITPAFKQTEEFSAKIKAGEVADAKKKKDAEARKQIESAITAFQPIKDGRIQYGLQAAQQDRLRRYVKQEEVRNADPTSILEQVRKEVARLYSVAERASERV